MVKIKKYPLNKHPDAYVTFTDDCGATYTAERSDFREQEFTRKEIGKEEKGLAVECPLCGLILPLIDAEKHGTWKLHSRLLKWLRTPVTIPKASALLSRKG